MKLNFNKSLQNLDGSEVEQSNMGKLLANVLSQANTCLLYTSDAADE